MALEDLTGRSINIKRIPFEVIGAFEAVGERFGPESDDRMFHSTADHPEMRVYRA